MKESISDIIRYTVVWFITKLQPLLNLSYQKVFKQNKKNNIAIWNSQLNSIHSPEKHSKAIRKSEQCNDYVSSLFKSRYYLPLKRDVVNLYTLETLRPMMVLAKSDCNCLSVLEENKFQCRQCILSISLLSPLEEMCEYLSAQTWIPFTRKSFCQFLFNLCF
mgnify:CR=1 FL=1